MNGDQTERLSQESECRNEGKCSILDAASETARRVLEEIEALAGTTACKSVQLVRLRKWAQEQGCWYEDYTNGQHDIFDAVAGNVLVGGDGNYYFIDTIIYPGEK